MGTFSIVNSSSQVIKAKVTPSNTENDTRFFELQVGQKENWNRDSDEVAFVLKNGVILTFFAQLGDTITIKD